MANNNNPTTAKKKLNNMKALSVLDNIIERNNNANSKLDEISIISNETINDDEDGHNENNNKLLDSMSQTLDNILLSSKDQIKQNKVSNIPTEIVGNTNVEIYQNLNVGDVLFTTSDIPIKVLEVIPTFESVPTYIVQFMNNKYILKWYNQTTCKNLNDLKKYLESLAQNNDYPDYILKPKIFTKTKKNGCFGCLYTNVTHEYFALKDIMNGYILEYNEEHIPIRKNIRFKNMNSMVMASINIAKAFSELNQRKEYFYAFYEENLLININNGDILIDISNSIEKEGSTLKPDNQCIYLSPEVLTGKSMPNMDSNNYTLAVILFRIFFHDHPLEGKAVIDDICLDFKKKMKYYSTNAVFILNPKDTSNKPVRGVHYTVLSMWDKYPQYLKKAFLETFCNKIFNPTERYTADQWVCTLLHLKSDILQCICGRVDFSCLYEFTNEGFYKCQRCGSKYHSLFFKNKGYKIPIYDGNNIYSIFFKDKVHSLDEIMGEVKENKIHTNLFGLKNVSDIEWKCELSNGDAKTINPSDVLPVFSGNSIDYYGSIAQFDFVDNAKK